MNNSAFLDAILVMTRQLGWAHEATLRAMDETDPSAMVEQLTIAAAMCGLLTGSAQALQAQLERKSAATERMLGEGTAA